MTDYANGSTPRILLRAYLSSDHISDATGKTIAVTISKNGGAFANPAAGATNATEIANGWYYVDLGAGDTGTNGPIIIRGALTGIDVAERAHDIVPATNGRLSALPATACTTNASLLTSGTGTAQIDTDGSGRVNLGKALGTAVTLDANNVLNVSTKYLSGTLQTARDIGTSVLLSAGTGTGQVTLASGILTANVNGDFTATMKTSIGTAVAASAVASVTGNVGGNVVGSVGSVTGLTASNLDTTISSRLASATNATSIATILTSTNNLPSDPADESLIIAATDAIMTRLGAPAGASVSVDIAAVKTDTAAIKTKTDSLAFTVSGQVDANAKSMNDTAIQGVGTSGNLWRGA